MGRLHKILSRAGVASRRASEQLMLDGRVTVNGIIVRELGTKSNPALDDIRVDGRRVKVAEHSRYLLLNKPRGYVTTRSDPQKRPTVIDLLRGVRGYVYPVGRLDFDTEGLLLLTNDGDLAARLTHPRHGVPRVYEARVVGVPDARDLERLASGVTIDGRCTAPADVELLSQHPVRRGEHLHHTRDDRPLGRTRSRAAEADSARLRVTIREGRNRQIRKMCEAIGHPVTRLTRIAIGPLRDPRLKLGHWRELSAWEVDRLRVATARAEKS